MLVSSESNEALYTLSLPTYLFDMSGYPTSHTQASSLELLYCGSYSIALNPAEKEGLVVFELKLGPVVRQLVVAVEAFPGDFVVLGALACTSERQVHSVHVLCANALRLHIYI